MHAAAAIFGRPAHADITGLIYLVLPFLQEIELLVCRNLHEGQWQHESRIGNGILAKPCVALRLEIGKFAGRRLGHP